MTPRDPPYFSLEHTAHLTIADMARMTPSHVRDTHHRLWVGEKTPASRAWSAEIRQFLEAVLAKAKSHEITHEEARRQVKQMIQTHGHARYIHGLYTYLHYLGWREKFMADLEAKPSHSRTESRLLADWAKLKRTVAA